MTTYPNPTSREGRPFFSSPVPGPRHPVPGSRPLFDDRDDLVERKLPLDGADGDGRQFALLIDADDGARFVETGHSNLVARLERRPGLFDFSADAGFLLEILRLSPEVLGCLFRIGLGQGGFFPGDDSFWRICCNFASSGSRRLLRRRKYIPARCTTGRGSFSRRAIFRAQL